MARIFPWVEDELAALKSRINGNPLAIDISLEGFLKLLKTMRTILVQDLAVLYSKVPESYIYSCPPFDSPIFREFAVVTSALIEQSETDAQLALQKLPENVAQTFHGALHLLYERQQEGEERHKRCIHAMFEEGFAKMQANSDYAEVQHPKKRRKKNSCETREFSKLG